MIKKPLVVKVMGKASARETFKYHTTPRLPKHKRESLSEIIERRKRSSRDARLVQLF